MFFVRDFANPLVEELLLKLKQSPLGSLLSRNSNSMYNFFIINYPQIFEKAIGLDDVQNFIRLGKYSTLDDLFRDLRILINNIKIIHQRSNELYDDRINRREVGFYGYLAIYTERKVNKYWNLIKNSDLNAEIEQYWQKFNEIFNQVPSSLRSDMLVTHTLMALNPTKQNPGRNRKYMSDSIPVIQTQMTNNYVCPFITAKSPTFVPKSNFVPKYQTSIQQPIEQYDHTPFMPKQASTMPQKMEDSQNQYSPTSPVKIYKRTASKGLPNRNSKQENTNNQENSQQQTLSLIHI